MRMSGCCWLRYCEAEDTAPRMFLSVTEPAKAMRSNLPMPQSTKWLCLPIISETILSFMKEIVQKLVEAEREMAEEKGPFLIFALFLREDAPDRWDVIVAAPWVTADKAGALQYIANKLGA